MLEKIPTEEEIKLCIQENPEFIVTPTEVIGYWSMRDWTTSNGCPLSGLKNAIWYVDHQKKGIHKTRELNGIKAYAYEG